MVQNGSDESHPLTNRVFTCEGDVAPALVMSRTAIVDNCLPEVREPYEYYTTSR